GSDAPVGQETVATRRPQGRRAALRPQILAGTGERIRTVLNTLDPRGAPVPARIRGPRSAPTVGRCALPVGAPVPARSRPNGRSCKDVTGIRGRTAAPACGWL